MHFTVSQLSFQRYQSLNMGLKGVCRVSAVLVVFVACAYECLLSAFQHECLIASLGYGLLSLIFSILSIACIDMIHLNPADSFTWKAMLDHYAWFTFHVVQGWYYFEQITKISKDLTKQQNEALAEILKTNGTTDYSVDHGINKVTTTAEFRKNVPFGSYEMMKGYIERLKEGDYKAFTNDRVNEVVYTSGTTGNNKFFPFVDSAPLGTIKAVKEYTVYRRTGRSMGRTLMIMHTYSGIPTLHGKPPITTMSSVAFYHRPFWTNPKEIFQISEEPSFLYGSAVFALKERELDGIKTIFSSMMFSFWVVISNNWRQMCDEIEKGYIQPGTLKVNYETLAKINSYMTPDPERANELRLEFSRGMFRIARRIWPRILYVDMVCTGSLAHPANLLKENQLYGIPFFSLFVSASEVMSCYNSDTEIDNYYYTLFPIRQYYEWIPEQNVSEANPQTLETAELEVGNSYEMVATTYAGLMRYRTGDVMKCVNKHNQLPIFVFGHRYGQLLNLTGEKMTEKIFYESLLYTCKRLKLQLTNYTCTGNRNMSKVQAYIDRYEDPGIGLPRYLLFCEFVQDGHRVALSEEEKKQFDENLRQNFQLYDQFRDSNTLGEMKVFEMKPGSFELLKNMMLQKSRNSQFKMPRVINNTTYLEFLLSLTEAEKE